MNNHFTQNIPRFLLLIVITLSSGCGQSTLADSPTLTVAASQTPTPSPINLIDKLVYSDFQNIYVVDFQNQEIKTLINISRTDRAPYTYRIVGNFVYIEQVSSEKTAQVDIFKADLSGRIIEQITKNGIDTFYDVSPNSNYLTYRNTDGQLVLLNIKTRTSKLVDEAPSVPEFLSWSPDSEKFIFMSLKPDSAWHLFLFSITENELIELSPHINPNDSPVWSPDGNNIVIRNYPDDNKGVLNMETMKFEEITKSSMAGGYSWSPDGDKIAFIDTQENETSIFVKTLQSGVTEKMTTAPKDEDINNLSWSQDGSNVVYELKRPEESISLCLLDLSSKEVSILWAGNLPDTNFTFNVIWSSGGEYVVYFTYGDFSTYNNYYQMVANVADLRTFEKTEIAVPGQVYYARLIR